MQDIAFTKMNGSGNDFILIDHRSEFLSAFSLSHLVQALCKRRESIGADGVILVEDSNTADFKWRFFNADGSEAEMCGNGGRCVARFAHEKGIGGNTLSFETIAGIIKAEVHDKRVKIQLPLPFNLFCNRTITIQKNTYTVHGINTGVPHAVVVVDDLEAVPIKNLGSALRFHSDFHPAGTNVNFIRLIDERSLFIRTYERGVEDETLACGTGSVASALVAAALDKVDSPVQVTTRGGEVLTVSFEKDEENYFSNVYLEGGTCLVYEGVVGEDVLNLYEAILGM